MRIVLVLVLMMVVLGGGGGGGGGVQGESITMTTACLYFMYRGGIDLGLVSSSL